jgi:hypothetical protein
MGRSGMLGEYLGLGMPWGRFALALVNISFFRYNRIWEGPLMMAAAFLLTYC